MSEETRNKPLNRKFQTSNLKGDYGNISFLLLLYILQGIPIGLSSAVPLLLQNRKVSYSDQALFSFVTWPFSLKLFWAPIVDSVYWRTVGRRKSWLVPVQMCIGLFMIILSSSIKSLITDDPVTSQKPNIHLLTAIFLVLNFLAATQDIAVDGWALTMLSRRNVGYASTCNTVGQTAGFFIGNIVFLALESANFCNNYLRSASQQSSEGYVTFEKFLYGNGIVFLVVTILVAIFKSEKPIIPSSDQSSGYNLAASSPRSKRKQLVAKKNQTKTLLSTSNRKQSKDRINKIDEEANDYDAESDDSDEQIVQEKELTVKETYSLLYKITKLSSLRMFAMVLLTSKIGFSAPDSVSGLKLIEAGVNKENMALLAVPMVPLQILLPWLISRLVCGPKPLDVLIKSYPYRLIFGLVFPLIVYVTPSFKNPDGTFPLHYYLLLIFVYGLHQVTVYSIFVSLMAFHAAVSDPSIGGTYMTLLNTIANLGGNWPATLSLWLVDKLTFSKCHEFCAINNSTAPPLPGAGSPRDNTSCETKCTTIIDGYYIECFVCTLFGFLWLSLWGSSRLRKLQAFPPVAWSVALSKKSQAQLA